MSEKKNVRFTFIDAIVALVIIAVVAFVGLKFLGKDPADVGKETQEKKLRTFNVTFYVEEAPSFASQNIKKGGKLSDDATGTKLGKIIDVKTDKSVVYTTNSQGDVVTSTREGYDSIMITAQVEAEKFDHGILLGKWNKYVVGHSMTFYADQAKVYGRVYSIEEVPGKNSSETKSAK